MVKLKRKNYTNVSVGWTGISIFHPQKVRSLDIYRTEIHFANSSSRYMESIYFKFEKQSLHSRMVNPSQYHLLLTVFGYVGHSIVPSDICFQCVTTIESFELMCAVLSFRCVLLFDCCDVVIVLWPWTKFYVRKLTKNSLKYECSPWYNPTIHQSNVYFKAVLELSFPIELSPTT